MNLTCNSTLEEMRISPGSEVKLVGPLSFHDLARIIASGSTLISVVLSSYLIWMHCTHYTMPREQKYIIRILFIIPVYSISSYMQIQWYWHAIYFQVLGDCIEAFVIASFFGLLCHYCAPDLHSQKIFFRNLRPIKPWVMPVNWFSKCCGGERGPWRTPKSGLTWFNIIWIGVYQYCFFRVINTVIGVITQHYKKYCESSNSPVFAHIWILVINAVSVTIAMFCLIQFYVQLSKTLAEHSLFIKVLAIKLVVFLSFWQAAAISIGTSTLNIVHPNATLAYPDIKVGIPALLLCVEMTLFAILHIWAFPYQIYRDNANRRALYPDPDPIKGGSAVIEKSWGAPSGGFLGVRALWDAVNPWDFVKAFGRGTRWLLCGLKKRKDDISYRAEHEQDGGLRLNNLNEAKSGHGLSYAPLHDASLTQYHGAADENARLMSNAQPNPDVGLTVSSLPSTYSTNAYPSPYSRPYDPPPYTGQASSNPYRGYDSPPPQRLVRPGQYPSNL